MSTLLFDIGGTNMRMAVGNGERLENIQKIATPKDPNNALAALMMFARELGSVCEAAVGGVAGIIKKGVVVSSPHLSSWNGLVFEQELSSALSIPVHIYNDAELAGLGEAVFGAGKDYNLVAYIGIGTGIGGCLIENKKVAPHAEGFEPGHQILDIKNNSTFEDLVSGHALQERFTTEPKDIPQSEYQELASTLAIGLYNVILEWSPDVLVLGGSLMNENNGYRLTDVQEGLKSISSVLPELPMIVRAQLADNSGLYGALAKSAS